ncbi:MAG TPA: hypothetical protein VGL81_20260 [Polyangiaceae bacterium]|jgi:hypothetical protein
MALSRSSRRIARALVGFGVAAAAFAGVLLAPRTAHAQRVYVYPARPAPPPPGYGYGRGYYARPAQPYYYQEPPYAFNLGFDLEGVAPINPPNVPGNNAAAIGGGFGFKVRAGEQFRFPGLRFTPELLYGYDHLWAGDNQGNGWDWSMNRMTAGARLGFGRIIVPTLYAHIGYGWRQTDAVYVTGANGGLAFDVGGALDFRVVPHFGFGVHLEYAEIDTADTPAQWVAVGGHIDLAF